MIQYAADGLVAGSILALGAAGLTLVYSILRFANFAHGDLVTWGAYLALTFLGFLLAMAGGDARPISPFSFGWPLLVALALSALATGGLALLLHLILIPEIVKGRKAPVDHADDEDGAPFEPLCRMDGRQREQALVELGGEHVPHAVGRRLERHVRQQRRQAPIACGDGGRRGNS